MMTFFMYGSAQRTPSDVQEIALNHTMANVGWSVLIAGQFNLENNVVKLHSERML